jgi:hypothetical protein
METEAAISLLLALLNENGPVAQLLRSGKPVTREELKEAFDQDDRARERLVEQIGKAT